MLFTGLLSIFFAAVLMLTFDRFPFNEAVAKDFIRTAERGGNTRDEHNTCSAWTMLYTVDPGIHSRSQPRLAKMMTAVVETCAAFGLVVAETKTITTHIPPRTYGGCG